MLFRSVVAALACSPLLVKGQNATSPSVVPANLTQWDWLGTEKMHGVALGNWLVLERWMNWQWFREVSGSTTAEDEWTFMEAFDDQSRAVEALTQHWETWITDEDVALMAQSGFNHIRIPIGYWAFIPQHDDAPYAFQAGQVEQMTRVIAAAQANGLYVLIDLHGLPGSQNGEQPSGRVGLNGFYSDANQALGDATVDAVLAYIEASPYRSAISGFEVCNEPVYYNDEQFQTLRGFYERSYEKIAAMSEPRVPMMFHPGSPNSNPLDSWQPFINGKDPNILVFTIHPYIGRGASLQGVDATESSLLNDMCSTTTNYQAFSIPVAITEWSLINPIVNNTEWEREWYSVQTAEYAKSGGGIFWSYRINITEAYDGEELITFYQYSFLDLLERGSIPLPVNNQTSQEYLDSLNSSCDATRTITSWPSPISGSPQSTSTGRAQRKRLLLHESL